MPTGANDANGIWQYGSDDPRAPFEDTLNLGQQSTSIAVGLLKSRASALEVNNDLSAVGSPFVAASGFTIVTNHGRKKAGLAFIRITATLTAAITVASDGQIGDTTMATFAAGWAPAAGMGYPASALTLADVGWITSGGIQLTAVAPGLTLAIGRTVSFTAVYPLA